MFGKKDDDYKFNIDEELSELDKDIDSINNELGDSEFDSNDNNKKSKKKSIKEAYDVTSEDLHQGRKKKITNYVVSSIFIGILILLVLSAIILFNRQSKTSESRTNIDSVAEKKDDMTFSKGALWQTQTNNKINRIEKKVDEIAVETKTSLLASQTEIQQIVERLGDDLGSKVQKMEEGIEKKITELNEQGVSTQKVLKNYTDRQLGTLKEEFAGELNSKLSKFSSSTTAATSRSGSVNLTENSQFMPLPPMTSNGDASGQMVLQNTLSEKEKTAVAEEKKYASLDVFALDEDDSVDYNSIYQSVFHRDANKTEPPLHIMTGFAEAILITGVSAPTFGEGVDNPKPVLLSIDSDLVIANDEYEDLRECMLTGSATGNMNSSRAEILVTRLSCSATKEDGSRVKIEHEAAPIGWVIGEDGKYGVSGRLVDSAGKILTRQLSVGFLQGVSMAFATPNMGVVPYGSTSIINGDTVNRGLSTGASQGVGTAFNSLADYYTKMLDGVYPYVDVKPGRKVTILFKGFEDVVKTEYEAITINDDSFIESDIEEIEIDYEDF